MLIRQSIHAGIDIGGTKCAGILLDEQGRTILFHEVPMRSTWKPSEIRSLLQSLITDLAERAHIPMKRIKTLGIGVPGLVDIHGKLLKAANLPRLERVQLTTLFPRMRITVYNDASCAIYAESLMGELAHSERGVLLMLGTGLGSAVMTRDAFEGNEAVTIQNMELGHICARIQAASAPDLDDEPYELGAYCSRRFFKRISKKSIERLAKEAGEGSEDARQIFQEFGIHLGSALATVETIQRPDRIVLGGGLMQYQSLFEQTMLGTFHARRFLPTKPALVLASAFGPEVGAIGAALYGMTGFVKRGSLSRTNVNTL